MDADTTEREVIIDLLSAIQRLLDTLKRVKDKKSEKSVIKEKTYTVAYREKGNPYGGEIVRHRVHAASFSDALIAANKFNPPELTYLFIFCEDTGRIVSPENAQHPQFDPAIFQENG